VCRVLGILVAVSAAWALTASGCGGSRAHVEADAGEPVLDGGADARDAAGDASRDTEPFRFTPAACDDGDGGVYQPPWGCPDACTRECEGDTMCAEFDYCAQRLDCNEWCEVELTVYIGLLFARHAVRARVCNRGAATAGKGSIVSFDMDGELLCEATVAESLEPCECVALSCEAYPEHGWVRATLHVNPDEAYEPCGNPLGDTSTSVVSWVD
jgi:hypothetical protein